MIAQEVAPTPWVEQEVVEAVLPQLGWHAEVKVKRTVEVLGGVIADEGAFSPASGTGPRATLLTVLATTVGYGKTAVDLPSVLRN